MNTWRSGEAVPHIFSLGSSRGACVTSCHFTPGKEPSEPIDHRAGWAPETVCALPGIISLSPSHGTHSVSTILAELNTPTTTTRTTQYLKIEQIKYIATSRKSPAHYSQGTLTSILVRYLVRASPEFGYDNIKFTVPYK